MEQTLEGLLGSFTLLDMEPVNEIIKYYEPNRQSDQTAEYVCATYLLTKEKINNTVKCIMNGKTNFEELKQEVESIISISEMGMAQINEYQFKMVAETEMLDEKTMSLARKFYEDLLELRRKHFPEEYDD